MHGSVCLFSKYLLHLFEGENLEELDISSKSSSNNVFTNVKSLSTGWTGTCPPLKLFNSIKNDYTNELSSLTSIFSSNHQRTLSAYNTTNNLINNLYAVLTITAARPSGSNNSLTPNFESEFRDKTNKSLIGGEIYYDFNNNLKPYIDELNSNIQTNTNSLLNSNRFKTSINDAYSNLVKFDTTVATASNVMNNRILDLKDYFLTLQFMLMFFTWGYLLFFFAIGLFYVIYLCKEYEALYYVILVLINLLFVMILLEIFLSSFFGQVRLICHEIPRAVNFIFTGNYMVSGNSGSYPAQFGRGDSNMTKMFTSCLNGDGNLISLFIKSSDLSAFNSLRNEVNFLFVKLNSELISSNLVLNKYNSIQNSIFLNAILKLELMKENLYLASEGFGDDDIYNILYNIRKNLDSENCSLSNEYYVIKESDCPTGSTKLSTIYNVTGVTHCYIIQNLSNGANASYKGFSCGNDYINKAISFIKQIDYLLDNRLEKLKNLQLYYSASFKNLSDEIYSISEILNNTYSILNSDLSKSSNISNCGSVRYDLIDFCDFIGDITEYDARIIVIFSSFLGVFGFVLLYSFLVVFNGLSASENDNDDYGYNYDKKKIKNINIKVNRSRLNRRETNDYDKDEDEDDDDDENYKKSFKNKRGKTPPKAGQKVEMTYMSKNNDDSDSS
jgi:hypothetical protein